MQIFSCLHVFRANFVLKWAEKKKKKKKKKKRKSAHKLKINFQKWFWMGFLHGEIAAKEVAIFQKNT